MNWFLFRNLIKHDLNEPSEDDKTKPSKNTILQKLLPTQESWSKLPSTHWPLLFSLYNITLHGRYLTLLPPIHLSMIIGKNTTALCSRNFQNVKLRLDFVEIWSFYRHSEFTWNQILEYSKMSFWVILEVLNFDF